MNFASIPLFMSYLLHPSTTALVQLFANRYCFPFECIFILGSPLFPLPLYCSGLVVGMYTCTPGLCYFFPSVFISVCNCLHIKYSTASRVCCSSYLSMDYTILACNMGAGQPDIYRSIETGLRPILFNFIISFSVPLSS